MTPLDHAQIAERLLNDPAYKAAKEEVERSAYEELLKTTDPADGFKRLALIDRINTIREIDLRIRTAVAVGQEAKRIRPGVA